MEIEVSWKQRYCMSIVAIFMGTAEEFDESCQLFENLSKQDPYRLDDLDVYSNVLFVLVSLQFGYACTAELKPNRLSGEIGSKQLVKL
eukprot:m.104828 g.104828  ORF g.104828 m.104828 type:complete len:88 (+) comp37215_c0_seq5:812-1075(+)